MDVNCDNCYLHPTNFSNYNFAYFSLLYILLLRRNNLDVYGKRRQIIAIKKINPWQNLIFFLCCFCINIRGKSCKPASHIKIWKYSTNKLFCFHGLIYLYVYMHVNILLNDQIQNSKVDGSGLGTFRLFWNRN